MVNSIFGTKLTFKDNFSTEVTNFRNWACGGGGGGREVLDRP